MTLPRLFPFDVRTRSLERELLDDETPPRRELARVAGYLAFVNRLLGGTAATARRLRGIEGPATVLDVGGGAGDVAADLSRRFAFLRPLLLDRSPAMLALAPGLPRVVGDARRLPFRDRSVDFVICTHLLHHLSENDAVLALREMDRVARRGIVVNDLIRRRRALAWIWLFTLLANRYVKRDGPLSVRKAFTVEEARRLADRAGLGWLEMETHFGHRFTLAGRRGGGDARGAQEK